MRKKIRGRGGMYAHLGTSDCRVIEQMIRDGDRHADLIFQAQAYQIAKAIGLLSIVLKGDCDAIILTGGDAHAFSERAKKENLLLVPADSFGCPGFFRISTCVDPAMIQRSLPAFRRVLQD